jgi:hypothetical protein
MTTCAGRHPAASKFTDCQGRFSDKTIPPEVLEPIRRQCRVDCWRELAADRRGTLPTVYATGSMRRISGRGGGPAHGWNV